MWDSWLLVFFASPGSVGPSEADTSPSAMKAA
jgi:hypothetical protein